MSLDRHVFWLPIPPERLDARIRWTDRRSERQEVVRVDFKMAGVRPPRFRRRTIDEEADPTTHGRVPTVADLAEFVRGVDIDDRAELPLMTRSTCIVMKKVRSTCTLLVTVPTKTPPSCSSTTCRIHSAELEVSVAQEHAKAGGTTASRGPANRKRIATRANRLPIPSHPERLRRFARSVSSLPGVIGPLGRGLDLVHQQHQRRCGHDVKRWRVDTASDLREWTQGDAIRTHGGRYSHDSKTSPMSVPEARRGQVAGVTRARFGGPVESAASRESACEGRWRDLLDAAGVGR